MAAKVLVHRLLLWLQLNAEAYVQSVNGAVPLAAVTLVHCLLHQRSCTPTTLPKPYVCLLCRLQSIRTYIGCHLPCRQCLQQVCECSTMLKVVIPTLHLPELQLPNLQLPNLQLPKHMSVCCVDCPHRRHCGSGRAEGRDHRRDSV